MTTTDTIVFSGRNEVEFRKEELPPLGLGQVLVETHRTAISHGTERTLLNGLDNPAFQFPIKPGYSLAGQVAAIGEGVTRLQVGDRVFATSNHAAECVVAERHAFKIPDSVSYDDAVFGNIASMAIYAVRRANFGLGDAVAVLGQGPIGLIANCVARNAGALPLIALDVDPSRLELGIKFGADIALDPRDDTALNAALAELPGGGVAAAIELTGVGAVIETAIQITRPRGTVFPGSLVDEYRPNIYGPLWWKGITIATGLINSRPHALEQFDTVSTTVPPSVRSSGDYFATGTYTQMDDFNTFFGMLATKRLDLQKLVTDRYKPEDAVVPFKRLIDGDKGMLGVIFEWR